ncbi:hypothetical protein PZ61_0237965 [Streptomyces sp. MNU77]|uniref:helix-turn-helix domain-containing protein n=1 Tax=Streptomyces sp. MNU77 TaxID=1573406 RepID=UPI0007C7A7EB|nr:helix-turn-helix domain-containing protein [Streptomyces sp. MNU77]OLO25474.1 hypothetical protein PZ61_0237965 [Streptomyces sp. MNU77]
MRLTAERQADLVTGLRLSQTQIRRKRAGATAWSLADLHKLAALYGTPVGDLLVGVARAAHCLAAGCRAPPPGRSVHHPPVTDVRDGGRARLRYRPGVVGGRPT